MCVPVRAGKSVTYLRLEVNSENVLPSTRVLRLQPQRAELGVYEEQPENGHTHNACTINQHSESAHREGDTLHCKLTAAIIRH